MENKNLMNNITDRELKLCALAISLYESRIREPESFPELRCMADDEIVNQVLQVIAEDPESGINELECLRLKEEFEEICKPHNSQRREIMKKNLNLTEDELNSLWLSAEKGDPEAQNKLGDIYSLGCGVPQDDCEAVEWYHRAAEQGNVDAQRNLGFAYDFGAGVPQDGSQALDWYRRAAEQGDTTSQNYLGSLYQTGQGVPQDYRQAAAWYRKAADQGNCVAQYNLASLYSRGKGVPRDVHQAAAWYRKAVTKLYALYTADAEALSGTGGEACEQEADEA